MTRKDYILLAEAFRVSRKCVATAEMVQGIDDVLENVCINLKRDNARFDKAHFIAVVRSEKPINSHPSRASKSKSIAEVL